jgi:hypothetical protein
MNKAATGMVIITGFENLDNTHLRPGSGDGDNKLEFIDRLAIWQHPSFFAYWRAFVGLQQQLRRHSVPQASAVNRMEYEASQGHTSHNHRKCAADLFTAPGTPCNV